MKKDPASVAPMRSLRKFNPGTLQSNEEVIRQFVVRHREFNTVLEVIEENLDAPSCQHVLIVAPRGRGKTMLLARLVAELRVNEMLAEHLWPVRFMEESQEIITLADFWLEVLFQLAQECQPREPELAQELKNTHASLVHRWRERNLEDYALAAVLDASDRLGRQLVLMIENLQAICQEVDDDFGWKLRKTLQTEPQIMLVATATSRFKGLDDAEQSFFELFRFVDLSPLTTCECQYLWKMASGIEITAREIRPLEILTGGSPRLLIIIAEFSQRKSLQQLIEELVHLIDDHTEYFRSYLQVLAKTERRVFLAIIDLWHTSGTGEIATRARMDVRSVSALLGRLVDRGAVTVTGRGRSRRYAAAERLYCIYYKLRRERDEAAVVHHLIHFMAAFYRKAELAELFSRIRLEANVLPSISEGIVWAMSDDQKIMRIFRELEPSEVEQNYNFLLKTASNLYLKGYKQWKEDKHQKAIVNFDAALKRLEALPLRRERQFKARILFYKAYALFELGELESAVTTCEEVVGLYGSSKAKNLQGLLASSQCLMGIVHWNLGESEAAMAACDIVVKLIGTSKALEHQNLVALAMYLQVIWKIEIGEFEKAALVCDELLQRFESSENSIVQNLVATALVYRGVWKFVLRQFEEAITTWGKVVERFGASEKPSEQSQVVKALIGQCRALIQLREFARAIDICDETVNRFGPNEAPKVQALIALVLVDKARLQVSRDCGEEALLTSDDLERRLGKLTVLSDEPADHESALLKWSSKLVRALALQMNGRKVEALGAFDRAFAEFTPSNQIMMQEMLTGVPELIGLGALESDLAMILSKDQLKSESLQPLICALNQLEGKTVRAPAEVLEVAADIRIEIEAKRRMPILAQE